MEPRPKFRRNWKLFFINPEFQMNFVIHLLGIAAVLISLFYAANLALFVQFYQKGTEMGIAADHDYFRFIDEQKAFMNQVFFWTSIAAVALLVGFGLVFSHRVAGPLFKLKKHMTETAEDRNDGDCSLRKKDYFHDVCAAYNKLLHAHRSHKQGNRHDKAA